MPFITIKLFHFYLGAELSKCRQYIYKISDLIFKKYLFLRSFVDAIKLFEDPDFHMQRKKFIFLTNTVAYLPFDLLT